MGKLRANAGFTLLFLIIALLFLSASFTLHYRAKLVPLIILIPMIVLCAMQLVMDLFPKMQARYESTIQVDLFKDIGQRRAPSRGSGDSAKADIRRREWKIFGWLAGLTAGIYLFGFESGIPVFLILFFRSHAIGWTRSLLTTALTWMFIHYVFAWYLHTPFPKGLLLSLLYASP